MRTGRILTTFPPSLLAVLAEVSAKIEPGDSVAGDETVRLASRGVYDSFSVAYKVNPASVTYVVEGGRRTRVIREAVALYVAPHRVWNDDLGDFEDRADRDLA